METHVTERSVDDYINYHKYQLNEDPGDFGDLESKALKFQPLYWKCNTDQHCQYVPPIDAFDYNGAVLLTLQIC